MSIDNIQNEIKVEKLDENQLRSLLEEYNKAEDEVEKFNIKAEIRNLTGLGKDLDLIFVEEEFGVDDIVEAFNYKKELIGKYKELVGPTEGLEDFGIEELDNLVVQREKEKEKYVIEDEGKVNDLVKEVEEKPINKLEVFNPDDVINKLDKFTKSENINDHHEVAKIIESLNKDQAAQIMAKLPENLKQRLKDADVPEFGRGLQKIESKNDNLRNKKLVEKETVDQYALDSKRKKAPRGYEKEELKDADVPEFGRGLQKIESKNDNLRNKKLVEKETVDQYALDSKRKKAPRGYKEDKSTPHPRRIQGGQGKAEDKNDEADSMDWPEAKDTNKDIDTQGLINTDKSLKMGWPEEKSSEELPKDSSKNEEANFEVASVVEMKDQERAKKLAEFFEEEGKKGISAKEILAQGTKTVISSAASISGIKAFYDVPRYLTQRALVRGNIMGIGKGKGMEGSIEDLLVRSQKSFSKEEGAEKTGVLDAVKDLDKRLKMTKEGGVKHSEQRKLIAKILRENRQIEKMNKEKRHEEISAVLDDYTTTKVTGMQAVKETLNTACVGTFMATGGASLKARAIMYMGLSAVEKEQTMKKEARKEIRRDKEKTKEEIQKAGEEVNMLKVIKAGVLETFKGIAFKGEGAKKEKIFKAIKAGGNILRFGGIAATSFLTPGALGETAEKIINAFRDKETLSNLPSNFAQGAVKRISFGLAGGAETTLEQIAEEAEQPTEELIVPEKVEAIARNYQGGGSVWQESENQLKLALGEDTDEQMTNRMTQFIARNPEKYGLPQDINFNSMSAEEIKNIDWNKALNDAIGNEKLPEVEVVDASLEENNLEIKEEIAENEGVPKNKVLNNLETEPEEKVFESLYKPDGTMDYDKYFKTEDGTAEANHLNELANEYYEATHNRANPMPRNLAFSKLKKEMDALEAKIGYKVSLNKDGNIFVNDNDGRHLVFDADKIEDYQNDGTYFAEKTGFNFDEYEKAKEFLETKRGMKKLNEFSELSKRINENDESLTDDQLQRLVKKSIKLRLGLEEKTGMGFYNEPNGDIVISKNYYYAKIFDGKTGNFVDDAPFKSVEDFDSPSDIATFDSDNFEKENINNEEEIAESNEKTIEEEQLGDDGEIEKNTLSTSEKNLAVKELSEKLNNNSNEILNEIKPIFADKYTLLEQEGLTKCINSEIGERNELLKLIDEYKKEYGDRPQFSSFRQMAEGRVETQNGQILNMLKGFSDSDKNYSGQVSSAGGGNPKMMAESLMERYSRKSGLLSRQELEDKAFDELNNKSLSMSSK